MTSLLFACAKLASCAVKAQSRLDKCFDEKFIYDDLIKDLKEVIKEFEKLKRED